MNLLPPSTQPERPRWEEMLAEHMDRDGLAIFSSHQTVRVAERALKTLRLGSPA